MAFYKAFCNSWPTPFSLLYTLVTLRNIGRCHHNELSEMKKT